MDIASLLGIVAGIGIVGLALVKGTAPIEAFWNLPSLQIVLGGTVAATFLAFPMREMFRIVGVTLVIFKKGKEDMLGPFVDNVVDLAQSARVGITELEKARDGIAVPFLRDGVQMIVNGYTEFEIRDILETRIENRETREKAEESVFRTMAKFAPAFGMIGTLVGLIGMLIGLGGEGEDAVKDIGPNMSVALVTTLYGVLLANLFLNPIAEKFKSRIEKQTVLQNMLIEGVVLLSQKKHPLVIREKLNSFIPPKEWKREEEEGAAKKAA